MSSSPVNAFFFWSKSILLWLEPCLSQSVFSLSAAGTRCQIVMLSLWSECLRQVEPLGSPRSLADEWVEGINPASLYHSADTLRKCLPDKWCSSATVHVVTEQPREQRDYYLGITWVVKTLDSNSVQEQCSMNHENDFDLWVCCEDKWMWMTAMSDFRLDINDCT